MKFTKTFGIFFLTFIIGCGLAFSTQMKSQNLKKNANKTIAPKVVTKEIKPIKIKTVTKPKVLNVDDFHKQGNKDVNTQFIEIGEVTNFEEFKVKSGESWFGFFKENGNEVIRKTKIKLKKKSELDLDWTDINITDTKRPAFLVESIRGVKKGKVETVFRGNNWIENTENNEGTEIKYGFFKKLQINDAEYIFKTEKRVSEDGDDLFVLLLEKGGQSQVITFVYTGGEDTPLGTLYWAGDIDNDGKLDFYMDFWGYEKGGYSSSLFVSSEAEKRKLVKEFGNFMLGGC